MKNLLKSSYLVHKVVIVLLLIEFILKEIFIMKTLILLPILFLMFPIILIVLGLVLGIIALFVLNWGPSAAYDYTGNNMLKREEKAKKVKTAKAPKSRAKSFNRSYKRR
jgi:hypothetical protein